MRVLILGGDGYLGWPTALRFSERGHDVSVVDNFARRRFHDELSSNSLTPIRTLFDRIDAWRELSGKDIQAFIGNIEDGEFLDKVVAESLNVPAHVWRQAMASFVEEETTDDLHKISAPTLIMWGALDPYFPRSDQETLAALIPQATLRIYEQVIRTPHGEQPELFVAGSLAVGFLIGRFIKGPSRAALRQSQVNDDYYGQGGYQTGYQGSGDQSGGLVLMFDDGKLADSGRIRAFESDEIANLKAAVFKERCLLYTSPSPRDS